MNIFSVFKHAVHTGALQYCRLCSSQSNYATTRDMAAIETCGCEDDRRL